MPPHREFDHEIHIENDQTPPHSHIYPLSGTELGLLREFLDDMLGKGFIDRRNHQVVPPFSLQRRRMVHCDSVLTSETSQDYSKGSVPDSIGHQPPRPTGQREGLHQA